MCRHRDTRAMPNERFARIFAALVELLGISARARHRALWRQCIEKDSKKRADEVMYLRPMCVCDSRVRVSNQRPSKDDAGRFWKVSDCSCCYPKWYGGIVPSASQNCVLSSLPGSVMVKGRDRSTRDRPPPRNGPETPAPERESAIPHQPGPLHLE